MLKKIAFPTLIRWLTLSVLLGLLFSTLIFYGLRFLIHDLAAAIFSILTFTIIIYKLNQKILHKYLYRRIELIYKLIRRAKVPVQDDTKDTNVELLSEVESEVRDWIDDQEKEIESLKNLEKYRQNFLGNISHELKTPIFSVQGYIHTLIDGGLYDDKVNLHYLKRAAKNIERLQTIVEDLDVIGQLEDATMILDIQQFDIKRLVLDVIEELEVQAAAKNISILLKTGADNSFKVKADRDYIRTILVNLITNSIKYGKQNGQTEIGFYDLDSELLLEVADNGIGIAEKHIKHLFDRFYRVDKSRSREMGGSGLGLSIVKHILEAHKQTINVRSTPGIGSTFGFTLEKA